MTRDSVTSYLRSLPPMELMSILGDVFTLYGVIVHLVEVGPNKSQVIKILRTRCPWMGLTEVAALLDQAPVNVPPPPGAKEWLRTDALKLSHELHVAEAVIQVR